MTTRLHTLLGELDPMVVEFGYYKTANAIHELWVNDVITESECRTARFQLQVKANHSHLDIEVRGVHMLDITPDLKESRFDADRNRARTDCVFNAVNGMRALQAAKELAQAAKELAKELATC